MIEICYTYKVERDGETKVISAEKAFPKFTEMNDAKKWARTKWNFLRWPEKKSKFTHTTLIDGTRIIIEGWTAKKDRGVQIDHFELTMTESYKES